MKHKLYVGDEYDGVDIGRDFASDIDDHFAEKELGRPHTLRSVALEERTGVPRMENLISFLKLGPPEIVGTAIELLDFSTEALENIADNIDMVRAEVRA